jgi:hypothetical protein
MRAKFAGLAAVSLLLSLDSAHAQSIDRARPREYQPAERAPEVSVWIDRYSYRPGQRLRAFFQSDPGAYVTIIRVTTTGDVKVLYPRTPDVQQPYRYDRLVDDEIPFSTDLGFYINEPEGVGFVFAIATYQPFDYRSVASRGRWSTFQLTGNRYSDPRQVVAGFIDRTLPRSVEYSTDYIQYQVAGTLYRPRRYGYDFVDYDDVYLTCLRYYRGYPDYYCRQFATYGQGPFIPIVIGRGRPSTPTPTTPGSRKPALPKKLVPDPMDREEGIKPQVPAQRSPTSNADTQRAWWNAQRKETSKGSDVTVFRGGSPRVDPQTPSPSDYRPMTSQPRIETRPETREAPSRRFEPQSQPSYDPSPRRIEAPVMRSEPMRSEPRYNPEPRVITAPPSPPPVERSEPAPREFHPAPAPPPPPPPSAPVDRGDPAPRVLPSSPPPPPPPASEKQ